MPAVTTANTRIHSGTATTLAMPASNPGSPSAPSAHTSTGYATYMMNAASRKPHPMEDQPKGRSPSEASGCFSHKRLLFPIEDDRDDDGEHGPEGELTEDLGRKSIGRAQQTSGGADEQRRAAP